jgi:mRNA interferase RelE/StbE
MNGRHYTVRYTELALENLRETPTREAAQIIKKISPMKMGLHGDIKRLQGGDFGYRLRMGNYRVLFDVQADTIIIQKNRSSERRL